MPILQHKPSAPPSGKGHEVDMTQGNVVHHLIAFALPLLAGNIFQQLYNTVDTWVVGNYVSNEAFSAVGTVSPIINTLIGFFTGLASGAGVVISQYYGAKQPDKVRDAVHTSIVMTLVLGVVLSLFGIAITPTMLHFMNTPSEVFPDSSSYLTIYFGGMMGLMLYNMGSGILRAVGDSKRPFYFLVVSAVLNIILDLVFVLVFHMGVEGVAYATIISQGMSAALVLFTLSQEKNWIRLQLRYLKVQLTILGKIIRVGIPAALQLAVTAFSNVFVQSYINFFGADYMSGWTAYTKIDQLMVLPMQSLALAATTFVGQNLGINQVDRAKKGTRTACIMAITITIAVSSIVIPTAPYLVSFFNQKPAVIQSGTLFLRFLSPFYVLCCINQVYSAALRGAGNSRTPMILMLFSFVLFRQCYLFVMANFISNSVLPIAMGYPAGWLVCSTLTLLYYRKVNLSSSRLVDDQFPTPAQSDS
ncbi:MATE family efflux transporter [Flavonifractor sp. An100]|uniref:MATE family efflux transporter n=1 Tax=Flavonifractor sp. An100 TaxID=1965538 RepID=UPI001FA81C27|nr:MATE family efflux transporter [Flavonifractor sp. An100]